MEVQAPALCADLTGEVCPMTFVKAKMLLDRAKADELVGVRLKEGEQLRSVSMSVKAEGHRIERVEREGDERYLLFIRKGA